jgi:hypothetical protein
MNGHLATVARNTESLTPLGQEMVAELQVDATVAWGELTITCHRDRIVGSSRPGAWVTSSRTPRAGGSSRTFSKALAAFRFRSSAASMMATR